MNRPHVVFLNRSFWPDTEATGQLLAELVTDLGEYFDVSVVAGQPNHVDDEVDVSEVTADYHGARVHRVWHSRFSKHSMLGRLTNLLTFTGSAWREASRLPRRPDILVAQSDPFFLPIVARKLQRKYQCPLVCYLQDIYPDIAVVVGKIREGMVTRRIRKTLFGAYQRASRIVVPGRDMMQRCVSHGVAADKIEVIANWTDTNLVKPVREGNAFRRRHQLDGQFVVMYSGNMGLAHDLDDMIDAAAVLRERTDISWLFIGEGARKAALVRRVEQLRLSQVQFLPYQPRSSLAQSLSAADVHLVSVRPGAAACVMPSKVYGILAAGAPTLGIVEPETELADLINRHHVGVTCAHGDAQGIAEQIRNLADSREKVCQFGANARRLSESQFSRFRQTARFGEMLLRVLGRPVPESIANRLAFAIRSEETSELVALPPITQSLGVMMQAAVRP